MYTDIPLWLSIVFILGGLAVLAWSSDVFVDGSAAIAKALGGSSFIIGMVVIGFGMSAPELCVSTMSGLSGHADLSLGNAYGMVFLGRFSEKCCRMPKILRFWRAAILSETL